MFMASSRIALIPPSAITIAMDASGVDAFPEGRLRSGVGGFALSQREKGLDFPLPLGEGQG